MFEGASHLIFKNAKELRNNMTGAEMALWLHLRKGVNGNKFRRQHPIGIYIADFYCHKAKLIVEIDGGIHNRKDIQDLDMFREKDLFNLGYEVIRFTNQQVFNEIEKVIENISEKINSLINK